MSLIWSSVMFWIPFAGFTMTAIPSCATEVTTKEGYFVSSSLCHFTGRHPDVNSPGTNRLDTNAGSATGYLDICIRMAGHILIRSFLDNRQDGG